MRTAFGVLATIALAVGTPLAEAAPTATTVHGAGSTTLSASVAINDLISGLIATEVAGDTGWHPANPASGNPLAAEGLAAFTDDVNNTGLAGLLNDFPAAGAPTKRIKYDLGGATDIRRIQILSGNDGKDGRVFSTTVIGVSTNGGGSFTTLGYFQSDPSGTVNIGTWGSTLVSITDDGGGPLASGVTHVAFDFYAVDNTQGEMRDPFNGVNPFTGVDDLLTAPISSPLIWEIDVIGVPEPSAIGLLVLGALGAAGAGRSRRRTERR
jgi:hypothetical protein